MAKKIPVIKPLPGGVVPHYNINGVTPEQEQHVRALISDAAPDAYPTGDIAFLPNDQFRKMAESISRSGHFGNTRISRGEGAEEHFGDRDATVLGSGFSIRDPLNRIWLNSDVLKNKKDLQNVLYHELGHMAAKGPSEEEANQFRDNVYMPRAKAQEQLTKEVGDLPATHRTLPSIGQEQAIPPQEQSKSPDSSMLPKISLGQPEQDENLIKEEPMKVYDNGGEVKPSLAERASRKAKNLVEQGRALSAPVEKSGYDATAANVAEYERSLAGQKDAMGIPEVPAERTERDPSAAYGTRRGEKRLTEEGEEVNPRTPEGMGVKPMRVPEPSELRSAYDRGGVIPRINLNDGNHEKVLIKEKNERILTPQQTKEWDAKHPGARKQPMNLDGTPVADAGGIPDAPDVSNLPANSSERMNAMSSRAEWLDPTPTTNLSTKVGNVLGKIGQSAGSAPERSDEQMLDVSHPPSRLSWDIKQNAPAPLYDDGGLVRDDENDEKRGAPADFGGPVFTNERGARVQADTDAPIPEPNTATMDYKNAQPAKMQTLPYIEGTEPAPRMNYVSKNEQEVPAPDPMQVIREDKVQAMKDQDVVGLGKSLLNERHAAPIYTGQPQAAPSTEGLPVIGRERKANTGIAEAGMGLPRIQDVAAPTPAVPDLIPPSPATPDYTGGAKAMRGELSQEHKAVLAGMDKTIQKYQGLNTPEGDEMANRVQLQRMEAEKWNPKEHGFWGKFGHYAAKAGEIAGTAMFPGQMAMLDPHSDIARAYKREELRGNIAEDVKEQGEKAAATSALGRINAEKYEYKDVQDTRRNLPTGEANPNYGKTVIAGVNKADPNDVQFTGQLAASLPKSPAETKEAHLNTYADLRRRVADGEQLTPEEEAQRKTLQTQLSLGKEEASNTNSRILNQLQSTPELKKKYATLPPEYRVYPTDTAEEAKAKMAAAKDLSSSVTGQQKIVLGEERAETAATAKQIRQHDADYVKPAEQTEKSYEMMDHAYSEYKDAQKQGKELPTGAQSMLALSTHLSTTFGNVKGSRITKDMIQEHLGARGLSDKAVVAIQRLTNGDQISPDQWDAFHNLVAQSRRFSWETAVREADRKHIPVDFLPEGIVAVKDKGHKAEVIPSNQWERYHKDHPEATELE